MRLDGRDPLRLRSGQAFDCVVVRFANDNFAQDDRAMRRAMCAASERASARTAAVLFILFDDEMIGHAGDVIADHARQRFLAGFLPVIVRES
jgi:hypothetical protein